MNMALFGATGRLGSQVLQQALEYGYTVNALVRDPAKLTLQHPNLSVHLGNAFNLQDVLAVVQGQKVVVSTLGGGIQPETLQVLSQGLSNISSAMHTSGIRRIVAIGSAGILQYDADTLRRDQPSYPAMFKTVSQAHLEAYKILQPSSLDWTLVCPPNMLDGAMSGQYRVLAEYIPEGGMQITTGDVAHFMLQELEQGAFVNKRVGIAN